MDDDRLNIFALHDEYQILERGIGDDVAGLGEIGEAQWINLTRHHQVLCGLYPEMLEYREALAAASSQATLPQEARTAAVLLASEHAQATVESEVPAVIDKLLEKYDETDASPPGAKLYRVASLLTAVGGMLWMLIEALPKVSEASAAAIVLWDRYWPLLQRIMKAAGF